jgi:hypothetical protein
VLPEPSLAEASFEVALDGAKESRAEILARVHRYDCLARAALDNDMRALLPQLRAVALPKKPEQILAGQIFMERRPDGIYVKSIDRCASLGPAAR